MDLKLAGKRVLVTGASKGIGLAIVQAFLAEGAHVTAVSRRTTPELEATGASFVAADLSTTDGPQRMVDAVLATGQGLDVLVNNAGGGTLPEGSLDNVLDGGDEIWRDVFEMNLHSAVRVTRAALPALLEAKGAVVNIGSDTARRVGAPGATPLPYAVAKAALNMFTRALAERVGPEGVRVNAVSPSLTRTFSIEGDGGYLSQVAGAFGVEHATLLSGLPKELGMLTGRMIEPEEIARAVLLLASPTMPSVIGSTWAVDAGSTKVA
ncbi:SDR family NAD(P)-dependent oxidoreductase [Lentzea jiangxiensis]|uniref:NAD(P)-dependent dehydrogenase, short-chain alcohol dehydrogenase family n=1 Tax=Lentzea jiangxiensis TaxID=641025 RepID=A0A1H0LR15_9PSEU|nr:SDR family oxidoreductase [Lentzea jiangxiensis]SDO70709.1 NAD(P)-dependent dehydrogenase, short-chain alcohol dehydrogenase family [Lentzea jiangxiensis]